VTYIFAYRLSCSPAANCAAANLFVDEHIGLFVGGSLYSYRDVPAGESLETFQHVITPTAAQPGLGVAINVTTNGNDMPVELCVDDVMVVPAP
jgi:hypothetical protein